MEIVAAAGATNILYLGTLKRLAVWHRHDGWRAGAGRDLRYAARRLRRAPGFTIAALATLGLGIGANTAIFSVINGVVLNPLPYPDADRLVAVRHAAPGAGLDLIGASLGTYDHYRQHGETLETITIYTPTSVALLAESGAFRVPAARVAQGFFEIFLHRAPPLGRALNDADQRPGSAAVAVISHTLWSTRYEGDPGIVGETLSVDGTPVRIVGVAPPEFDVPSVDTQVWLPQQIDPQRVILGGFGRTAVGRLQPGVSPEQARADLQRLIPTMAERFNPVAFDLLVTGGELTAVVTPLKEDIIGDVEQMLWIVLGTVLFVLAVACANVANLFLARAEGQGHEIAVRNALGAGRAQLVRHHLSESLLLGLGGGALGVLPAIVGVRWVVAWGPATIPRLHEVGIDAAVLVFAAAISVGVGIVCGMIPVLGRRRSGVAAAIADGGRNATSGPARYRVRNGLVVAQVSLALMLLVGAGLMVRTFWHLRGIEPGFDAGSTLVFQAGLPPALYPERVAAMQFQQRVIDRLEQIPGVATVGATGCLPLAGCDGRTPVYADDIPVVAGQTPPSVDVRGATAGYFSSLKIPIVEGRGFETEDPYRVPVAVVSANLAARLWPGESAIGKRIHADYPTPEEGPYTVVGVAGDHLAYGLATAPPEYLYVSYLGPYGYVAPPHTMTFVIRTAVAPLSLATAVRAAVRELDANVPIANLRTMQDVVDRAAAPTTFAMILLLAAGAAALVLGAVGVYGVLSYVVSRRAGEIGVRIALGARAEDVERMVLAQGAGVVATGIVVGLAGSLALSRLMDAVLFGVAPHDPPTYAVTAATLGAIALVATWLPARRAAHVDPIVALRAD